MLSKEELSRYGTGTLTNIFLDRVFQECLTYDGEMVITYFSLCSQYKSFGLLKWEMSQKQYLYFKE